MTYELKPLSCDPAKLNGLSEKLIVSHWENNYGGAVKRLNARKAETGPVTVIFDPRVARGITESVIMPMAPTVQAWTVAVKPSGGSHLASAGPSTNAR